MRPPGLAIYRGTTRCLEPPLAPLLRVTGRPGSAWRASWTGASAEAARAAGSVWVHAASLGEVGAAARWIATLIRDGYRAPLLLTTRTRAGLERARRELGADASVRIAPQDLPRLLRSFLEAAAPARLDIIETELWPNLILETRRRGVPIAILSAAVSGRTARRLDTLGVAGPRLLGEGVWALAQSPLHAARFRSLGIPEARIRVVGDLKAESPLEVSAGEVAGRPAVVFGSIRRGEEELGVEIARALGARAGGPAVILAPRHDVVSSRLRALLRAACVEFAARDEAGRASSPLGPWISALERAAAPRVGLLETRGELAEAYAHARLAIVGGSFRPYGGHSVLEPAARGCPLLIGPHHEGVEAAVIELVREEAVRIAGGTAAAAEASALLDDPGRLGAMAEGAIRVARAAAGAADRALAALRSWGLEP